MSQFLLDSNIISELWRNDPEPKVLEWLGSSDWMIPVVIIAEIQEGAESAPSLARREEISRHLAGFLREFSSLAAWGQSHIITYAALFRKLYTLPNPLGQ